jgi:small-conductance mechanosensitive channel/CRP-like cAMP-binding protein
VSGTTLAILQRWLPVVIGAGVVLIAALVNRFARQKRKRIRRLVILYGLFLACLGASAGVSFVDPDWSSNFLLAAHIFEAFVLVNLFALVAFDLALPAVGLGVVTITSDIIVGIAYLVSALGALRSAGMNPSSLLTTSAVLGGVLTLSLQATLGNLLGGVALQLDGSIKVGDWIQLDSGRQGLVKEIRWRHTVVETRDWDTIIVPNAALLGGAIIILGKRGGKPIQHRMTVPFNVDYRFSPTHVIDVVTEGLQSAPIEGVAPDPPPFAFSYDFAQAPGRDSFGYYAARYWLIDLPNDDAANSRIRSRVYAALRRAGIPLARPTHTVFVENREGVAEKQLRWRDERLDALKHLDLFKSLNDPELASLADRLSYAPFIGGEIAARAGTAAHYLFVLTKGKVDVLAKAKDAQKAPSKVVATLEAPSFFGEMGLMTGEPRAADVIARGDVECYRLDKQAFQDVLSQRPEIAEAMSKTLAHRRVELDAIREGLDADARRAREASEQEKILSRIQTFFGLREQ